MCVNSANYKAVQSLSLSTLNYERTSILLQYFMEHGEGACIAFPFPGFMKSILLWVEVTVTMQDQLAS